MVCFGMNIFFFRLGIWSDLSRNDGMKPPKMFFLQCSLMHCTTFLVLCHAVFVIACKIFNDTVYELVLQCTVSATVCSVQYDVCINRKVLPCLLVAL